MIRVCQQPVHHRFPEGERRVSTTPCVEVEGCTWYVCVSNLFTTAFQLPCATQGSRHTQAVSTDAKCPVWPLNKMIRPTCIEWRSIHSPQEELVAGTRHQHRPVGVLRFQERGEWVKGASCKEIRPIYYEECCESAAMNLEEQVR
jgi:hypothetical protein